MPFHTLLHLIKNTENELSRREACFVVSVLYSCQSKASYPDTNWCNYYYMTCNPVTYRRLTNGCLAGRGATTPKKNRNWFIQNRRCSPSPASVIGRPDVIHLLALQVLWCDSYTAFYTSLELLYSEMSHDRGRLKKKKLIFFSVFKFDNEAECYV